MEERTSTWQKILEEQKLIDKKRSLIMEKFSLLKKELENLDNEEFNLIDEASEEGTVQISVGEFERAAQKLDSEHRPVKVAIRYDDAERKDPLSFKTPETLREAKNFEGTPDYRYGQIQLRINNSPRYLLKKCYLPESCEHKENPTVQDLVMCFWTRTVAGSKHLISIFAQAEKDRVQTTNPNLSDGGKK